MQIKRKAAGAPNKPTTNTPNVKMEIEFSITYLKFMLCYTLFHNCPNMGLMKNFSKILNLLSPSTYINDHNKCLTIDTLLKLLDIRLSRISHPEIIVEKLLEGKTEDESNEILLLIDDVELHDLERLTDANIDECARYIDERLRFSVIFKYREELEDKLNQVRNNNFTSFESIATSVESTCKEISYEIRKAMYEKDFDNSDFSLSSKSDMIRQVHAHYNKPSNIITTGIQLHNRQLNGGYQAGRVYLYLALSGGGKSMFLLNILRWFTSFNKHIKAENPNLKPVALYVTQENDMYESIERLFNLCVPEVERDFKEYKDLDPVVIEELWNKYGFDGTEQDIVIRYRPNKSIDTADLDSMITELAEQGKEVKLLIHDYIKRINPVNSYNDIRLDLGAVIDEFSVIAKQRKIPVVTASQLNREALRKVNESAAKATNVVEKISGADVGESALIIENCDYAFVLYNQDTPDGSKYLTFNRIKSRGKLTYLRNFIAQPYDKYSRVVDDINMSQAIAKLDLSDTLAKFEINKSGQAAQPAQGASRRRPTDTVIDDIVDDLGNNPANNF